ncbi:predicted protein [Streptomyces viridosporus ATCC 14672]|uniref:Predicted protein n=1 Tax=Streptomyces viridosporus (strain ATCC 14672 / DSM 40746 / JCM 4963 / KCTC 9882 / NRRL B-12104 / FH 1290) TaxID=566461 RepID=D5ZU55_STRV1|nr:predicted protein [Streptomyces viridosporus ATCC 14672]
MLIKVLRTGICGTDLHIRAWDGWARQAITTPLVLGHDPGRPSRGSPRCATPSSPHHRAPRRPASC